MRFRDQLRDLFLSAIRGGTSENPPAATRPFAIPYETFVPTLEPKDVGTADVLALQGDFSKANDILDFVLMTDDRWKGCVGQLSDGLLTRPVAFKQDEQSGATTPVEIALTEDWKFIGASDELRNIIHTALAIGFVWVEATWTRETDYERRVCMLRMVQPRFTPYDNQLKQWNVLDENRQKHPIYHGKNGKWFLFTPYGVTEPWKHGHWRAVAIYAIVKKLALRNWNRYTEAHGSPLWWLKTPDAWDQKMREKFANLFVRLSGNKAVATPTGVEVDLKEASSPTYQGFDLLIDRCNMAITIGVMSQNLTTEVSKGAKASTVVHADISNEKLKALANTVSVFLQTGPIGWYVFVNFGKDEKPTSVEWDTRPRQDRLSLAQADEATSKAFLTFRVVDPDGQLFDQVGYLRDRGIPTLMNGQAITTPPVSNKPTDTANDTGGDKPAAKKK